MKKTNWKSWKKIGDEKPKFFFFKKKKKTKAKTNQRRETRRGKVKEEERFVRREQKEVVQKRKRLSILVAFSISCWFRLSVLLSTVLVHLVATGRVSPSSVISMFGLSAIEVLHLNCIAAEPTVFCVCNAWLWGQLSFFQMRVRSLGRWLEVSIRVVEDVFTMWMRMLFPGGFVGCRDTFSTVFWMRRTVLGTAVQSQIEFDCISSWCVRVRTLMHFRSIVSSPKTRREQGEGRK